MGTITTCTPNRWSTVSAVQQHTRLKMILLRYRKNKVGCSTVNVQCCLAFSSNSIPGIQYYSTSGGSISGSSSSSSSSSRAGGGAAASVALQSYRNTNSNTYFSTAVDTPFVQQCYPTTLCTATQQYKRNNYTGI